MTLRDFNLQMRRRLRRDAWLLTIWRVVVGFAVSRVVGALLVSGIISALHRTWSAGLAFFVASAAAGALLTRLGLGAATVADLCR